MLFTPRHVKHACQKMAHLSIETFLTSARGSVQSRNTHRHPRIRIIPCLPHSHCLPTYRVPLTTVPVTICPARVGFIVTHTQLRNRAVVGSTTIEARRSSGLRKASRREDDPAVLLPVSWQLSALVVEGDRIADIDAGGSSVREIDADDVDYAAKSRMARHRAVFALADAVLACKLTPEQYNFSHSEGKRRFLIERKTVRENDEPRTGD